MERWAKGRTARAVTAPTITPRVAAPAANPATCSAALSGGVMKSPMSPFILAWSRLEDELEKALLRICIMIRPGATKVAKRTPSMGGAAPFTATTKTSI